MKSKYARLFFFFINFFLKPKKSYFHKHKKAEGIVFEPLFDQTPVASQRAGEDLLQGLKVGHIPTKNVGGSSTTACNLQVLRLSLGREISLFAVPNQLKFL